MSNEIANCLIQREFIRKCSAESLTSAVDLYVERLLERLGVRVFPVPLQPVLEHFSIAVPVIRNMAIDGALVPVGPKGYKVYLSRWASADRRRFSLAHEIGHAIIHRCIPETRAVATRSVLMPPGHEAEERMCDLIASRLLMPASLLQHFASDRSMCLDSVFDLAESARVSLSAAGRRISEWFATDTAMVSFSGNAADANGVLNRTLYSFAKGKSRPLAPCAYDGCSVFVKSLRGSGSVRGWQWVRTATTRRSRLFVECRRVGFSSSQQTAVALLGRHEFQSRSKQYMESGTVHE